MKNNLHFYISRGENMYVAECVELAIVTQGENLDVLVKNIKEATELHLEVADTKDYGLIESPYISLNYEFAAHAN